MTDTESTGQANESADLPPPRVGAHDQRPSQKASPNAWVTSRLAEQPPLAEEAKPADLDAEEDGHDGE